MAKYEGSPADRRNDAKQAKKRGMSAKDWENSAADEAMDRAGQRQLDHNTAEHHFAHGRPRTDHKG